MRTLFTLKVSNSKVWERIVPTVRHYLEEGPISLVDPDLQWEIDRRARNIGFSIILDESVAERAKAALLAAPIYDTLTISCERILPQNDPHEQKILEKLYVHGDTTLKPKPPKDRYLPSKMVAERKA